VIVTVRASDGSSGRGYAYTIGTGGSSVVALLRDHLGPRLLGRDPQRVEAVWRDLFFHTHATAVGPITSLALAAVDTALWDRNCRVAGLPLWRMAGGAQSRVPVYTTEGGWLQLPAAALVEQALAAREQGFLGAKLKVGKPHVAEDMVRLAAVREAVGSGFELMVDANQSMTLAEAVRRARRYQELDLAWLEEPMPAEHVKAHAQLVASTALPIAVGESLYHPAQFAEYIQRAPSCRPTLRGWAGSRHG
jgi:L-alanine-DL-glutamate epimerase-like enolase superfamily enzyme